MSEKKKKIILVISALLLMVGVILTSANVFESVLANGIKIDNEKCVVEYGNQVNENLSHYLKSGNKNKIEKKSKFYFNVADEQGKDYPAVGNYTALIRYKGKIVSFRVKVEDTVVPEFINFNKHLEVPVGTTLYELSQYFAAEDLSGVKIMIESDTLDLNTEGKYAVSVIAKDPYGNYTSKTCHVSVVDDRHGLANSGSYFKGDKVVYFEEYYDKADAIAARNAKASIGGLVVSDVFETQYKGKTVYRYEWYEKSNKEDHKQEENNDNDSEVDNIYPDDDYPYGDGTGAELPETGTGGVETPVIPPSTGGGENPVNPPIAPPETGGGGNPVNPPITPPETGGGGNPVNPPITPPETGGGGTEQPVTPPSTGSGDSGGNL